MKRQIIAGIGWTTIGSVLKQAGQLTISIFLARLLTPADFGLMAMALVFARFAWIFSELGLAGAVIQRQEITEAHLSSIFWVNLAFAMLVTLVFIVAAPLIAGFYNEPDLVPIVMVIASTISIGALNDVQFALMRRNMQFYQQTIVAVSSVVLSGLVAIGMALMGFGVWSLVMQTVVSLIADVAVMWFLSDWHPKLLFDRQAVQDILHFSLNLQGFSVAEYLVQNGDNLLLGRFIDVHALGIYQIAFRYMKVAPNLIIPIFSTVMIPGLSRVQNEHQRLRLIYIKITQVVMFLTLPMSVGLIVVADSFVLALLGDKWVEAILLLRILGLAAIWFPLVKTRAWLLIALGRTDVLFRWQIIEGALAIIALLIGVQFGVQGVAVAYVVRTWLLIYPLVTIPGKLINLSFWSFMKKILPNILVSAMMAFSVWLATVTLIAQFAPLVRLITQVALGGLVYGGLALAFRLEVFGDLVRIVREASPKAACSVEN